MYSLIFLLSFYLLSFHICSSISCFFFAFFTFLSVMPFFIYFFLRTIGFPVHSLPHFLAIFICNFFYICSFISFFFYILYFLSVIIFFLRTNNFSLHWFTHFLYLFLIFSWVIEILFIVFSLIFSWVNHILVIFFSLTLVGNSLFLPLPLHLHLDANDPRGVAVFLARVGSSLNSVAISIIIIDTLLKHISSASIRFPLILVCGFSFLLRSQASLRC